MPAHIDEVREGGGGDGRKGAGGRGDRTPTMMAEWNNRGLVFSQSEKLVCLNRYVLVPWDMAVFYAQRALLLSLPAAQLVALRDSFYPASRGRAYNVHPLPNFFRPRLLWCAARRALKQPLAQQ
jgi:hypothetical protein